MPQGLDYHQPPRRKILLAVLYSAGIALMLAVVIAAIVHPDPVATPSVFEIFIQPTSQPAYRVPADPTYWDFGGATTKPQLIWQQFPSAQ